MSASSNADAVGQLTAKGVRALADGDGAAAVRLLG
jgi:hypothetical protein